jgi:anti-anti-sigma factor
MYETDRRCHAAPTRSDLSAAPKQTDAPRATASGPVSVRLLAAHEQHEHVAVLGVRGEIDLGTGAMLREVLLPVLERQTGPVVVDLSQVPFMDSTGVHVLLDTLRRLQSQHRPLALVCHEEGQVHRLLAMVGLLAAVTVYGSRESAVIAGNDAVRSKPSRNSDAPDARDASGGLRTDLAPGIY